MSGSSSAILLDGGGVTSSSSSSPLPDFNTNVAAASSTCKAATAIKLMEYNTKVLYHIDFKISYIMIFLALVVAGFLLVLYYFVQNYEIFYVRKMKEVVRDVISDGIEEKKNAKDDSDDGGENNFAFPQFRPKQCNHKWVESPAVKLLSAMPYYDAPSSQHAKCYAVPSDSGDEEEEELVVVETEEDEEEYLLGQLDTLHINNPEKRDKLINRIYEKVKHEISHDDNDVVADQNKEEEASAVEENKEEEIILVNNNDDDDDDASSPPPSDENDEPHKEEEKEVVVAVPKKKRGPKSKKEKEELTK